jgi:hypothetical protein
VPLAGLREISSRSMAPSRIAPSNVTCMLIVRGESGLSRPSFAAMKSSTVSNVISSIGVSPN